MHHYLIYLQVWFVCASIKIAHFTLELAGKFPKMQGKSPGAKIPGNA